ncbi:hypothetical protein [Priestia aryabhattai]|uniref:hypothetical protein n=1 Tax=Priestia aryabhattai TaxID=412384 RepID=UPI001C8E499D|nr:hypothetical protein [Priestia aryabhattai]MBX9997317.1 hypothetical protein [Priestia aryabhattai]
MKIKQMKFRDFSLTRTYVFYMMLTMLLGAVVIFISCVLSSTTDYMTIGISSGWDDFYTKLIVGMKYIILISKISVIVIVTGMITDIIKFSPNKSSKQKIKSDWF